VLFEAVLAHRDSNPKDVLPVPVTFSLEELYPTAVLLFSVLHKRAAKPTATLPLAVVTL
jgi:hypothetical protein